MQLARLTAVAALLTSGGCADVVGLTSTVQIGANPVRLAVSTSSAEIVRGTPATLGITLANEGTTALTLHFSDSCQIVPYIRNASGDVVLPSNGHWGCASVLTHLTLLPGQRVNREFVWTGSTAFSSEMPLRPLPVGKYSFTGEVPSGEATLRATVEITLR